MKKTGITLLLLTLFYCVQSQQNTRLYKNVDKTELNRWVDSVYRTLSVDEKVGQLFMPVVEPNSSYKSRIQSYIQNQKVGGFLFSKGGSYGQAENINYAQSISRVPLLIAADAEWGLSMRLNDAPVFPRNQALGSITNDETLFRYGEEVARQCREMGIHINFAPALDVNTNPNNPIIGDRSFGANAEVVTRQGIAYAKGLEAGGVMAVAKHFPGHGDTSEDSHKTLPTITHPLSRLNSVELFPFKHYISEELSGMMIGHLNVPALQTNNLPATLSPNIGEKLLKNSMGFTGLIFTDGMAMSGVSNQPDMSVRALLAGNDIVLGVVNQAKEFESVKKAVVDGVISQKMLEEKVRKILAYKYILNAHRFTSLNSRQTRQNLQSSNTEWVQRKLYDGALTLLKNDSSLLPFKHLDEIKIASVAIGTSYNNDFQNMLRNYCDVKMFQVTAMDSLQRLEDELKNYTHVIFSLHSSRYADSSVLQRLTRNHTSVFVFLTPPSQIDRFQRSASNCEAVLLAQDESKFAQMSAAQGIFGGIPITGKLSIATGIFPLQSGIATPKMRLSYNLPEEVGISSASLSKIDEIANEGVRRKAYPGCQILVAKNGVVIYEKAFGTLDYSSATRATTRTVYDLASVTKATATLSAVMKLYDEGKIHLHDEIGQYLPETKGSNKEDISVRELLMHESGIVPYIPYYTSAIDEHSYSGKLFGEKSETYSAYYAGAWGRTDYRFHNDLISNAQSSFFNKPVAQGLYASQKMHDVLLKDIIKTKLLHRGEYKYSCLNFMLLKEIVEHISHTDMHSFTQQAFFRKLGAVTTSYLPLTYQSINDIAPTEDDPFFRKQTLRGYVHDEGAALFGGVSGNAGLFSNANDLAKLLQMWLYFGKYGGETYLKSETVALFTKGKSDVSRRGLGFDRPDATNPKLSPAGELTPPDVFGHTGFTGTCFWVDPHNQLIYIFLSNRVHPQRSPNRLSELNIRERIQDVIYQAIQDKK